MKTKKVKTTEETERYRQKKREENRLYYAQTAHLYPRHFWTDEEEKMVMEHSISDRELSEKIKRSMKSIQEKRRRMRREAEALQSEE